VALPKSADSVAEVGRDGPWNCTVERALMI
jgi:hypothetical protein